MAEQTHHIHYSQSDIDRYLRGVMSATDMHELERAALQDPFLADALEGYADADATTSQQHLAQITAALLQPAREEVRVVPLPRSSPRRWMNIAAMAIVLGGTGLLGWYFIQKPQQSPVANIQLSKTDHPVQTVIPPPAPTDTLRPVTPATADQAATVDATTAASDVTTASREKTNRSVVAATPEQATADASVLTNRRQAEEAQVMTEVRQPVSENKAVEPIVVPAPAQPAVQALAGRLAGVHVTKQENRLRDSAVLNDVVVMGYGSQKRRSIFAKEAIDEKAVYQLRGTVTDNEGKPLANATVKSIRGFAVTTTDQQGSFHLKAKDSAATVTISSVGYESVQARVNQNNTRIRLEEAGQSLSEVVVTEMYSRKNAAAIAPKDSTYPAGGWQSFQEYVAKKLNRAVDTTGGDQRFTGREIELEVLVEKDGNPRNVRIIRSNDDTLNNQAIEAVKNGPRWITGSRKKKARVIVRF